MIEESQGLRRALAALRRLTPGELDAVATSLLHVSPGHEALRGLSRDELAVVAEQLPFIRLDVVRGDVKEFGLWCDRNATPAAGYESLWTDHGGEG